MLTGFGAAFAGYEVALFVATAVLPSEPSVFGLAVDLYILKINAMAFAALLVLQHTGQRIGLVRPRQSVSPTSTAA
jgi:hypothetical protein